MPETEAKNSTSNTASGNRTSEGGVAIVDPNQQAVVSGGSPFTVTAQGYFDEVVNEYVERLEAESKNIEKLERVGDGPAEITAAHVEEAKWILLRRMRRRAIASKGMYACRGLQLASAVVVGVSTSYLTQVWGGALGMVAVAVGFCALMWEVDLTREY